MASKTDLLNRLWSLSDQEFDELLDILKVDDDVRHLWNKLYVWEHYIEDVRIVHV